MVSSATIIVSKSRVTVASVPELSVLLIEDHSEIARQILEYFEGLGWATDYADNGAQGISLASKSHFDVIILDLNLPDADGLDICQSIKQNASHYLPILMLTARDSLDDISAGFLRGSDDYLTKPFELRELELRCQALSRRALLHQNKTLCVGELALDREGRQVRRQGKLLELSNIGFEILLALVEAHPKALSRSMLIQRLWGDNPPDSDALRSHIYALRNVLDKPFEHAMLKTLVNVGYRLDIDDEV